MRTEPNETLEALLSQQGRNKSGIYWFILAGLLTGLVAIFVIRVDVTVTARGAIRPELERIVILAPVDGYIEELQAVENKPVAAGALLLRLKSDFVDEALRFNRREQEENELSVSDLDRLLQWLSEGSVARPMDALHLAAYRAEWEYYQSRLNRAKVEQERAAVALARAKELHALGAVAEQAYQEASFNANSAEADMLNLTKESVSRWEADRRARVEKLASLQSERKRLEHEERLRQVRAPAAGVVMGFTGMTPGQYTPAGTRLGEISPAVHTLIEALVPAKDIGFVTKGQRVRIQVDAYPHSRWGAIEGDVTEIATDRQAAQPEGMFKVTISARDSHLRDSKGYAVEATRGMGVTACFVVTRLTLFEMLIESTSQWLNPNDVPLAPNPGRTLTAL